MDHLAHHRGLVRPIVPQDAQDLALADLEVDGHVGRVLLSGVGLVQVLNVIGDRGRGSWP